jgi:pimeloyl-ACP methyl ester carboxylesterase
MSFVIEGRTIEVRQAGEGPSLLLIHGYPLDGAMWSSVARRLSDRFSVFKPDLPGRTGNPMSASGSLAAYADFVASILDRLEDPVGLAGFSMGGYVSLELMRRRHPKVGALALVDTRAVADDEAAKANREKSIGTLKAQGVAAIADAMLPRLLSPEAASKGDLAERVRRIILRQTPEGIESDLKAMRDRSDSTAFLPQIAVPTLVIAGEQDVISTAAESQTIANAIPGAGFVVIPGAGHLTPMENPSAVAQALGEFFETSLRSTV